MCQAGGINSAEEQHGGKVAVTIGSQTEYFDPPHEDIDTQAVASLGRMLTKAGYGAGTADAPIWAQANSWSRA
jgi:hypothetical protein